MCEQCDSEKMSQPGVAEFSDIDDDDHVHERADLKIDAIT